MKILLLGSLISQSEMEELNNVSSEKASVAPVNYETMLVKGLMENGVQVEALSIPAVAAFPHSKKLFINKKSETIFHDISIQWVPFVNIQFIKQISIKMSVRNELEKWLKTNEDIEDKVVLMYSIYPPYSAPALDLCKKYHTHLCSIITDLPELMYTWKSSKGIKGWYSKKLSDEMLMLQDKCDSYVLFTKPMAERMGLKTKPFIVSEGFSDTSIFSEIKVSNKDEKFTIVYGGNLSRLYGIRQLADAFMSTDLNAELHFYGAGEDADYLKMCQVKDNRIRFFGRVSRVELLSALKKAHLLVINKPTSDEYSKYSFSSKILEYMASGTPILSTRVGGMPEEYEDKVFLIEDETEEGLCKALKSCVELPPEELILKGKEAKLFAEKEKNYLVMTNKLLCFLSDQISNNTF